MRARPWRSAWLRNTACHHCPAHVVRRAADVTSSRRRDYITRRLPCPASRVAMASALLLLCLSAAVTAAGCSSESSPAYGQYQPRSCLQLQRAAGTLPAGVNLPDGVYHLPGLDFPIYCDFSHDSGGWTLLLTAVSRAGWDLLEIDHHNAAAPSLTENYSILGHGDELKALGASSRFAYRLEGLAQTGRQQWGGIWLAPRRYTFTHHTDNQRSVTLVRKFSEWTYGNTSIQNIMPWINVDGFKDGWPVLTTADRSNNWWFGTLISSSGATVFQHSPWIGETGAATQSGTVLYWVREEETP